MNKPMKRILYILPAIFLMESCGGQNNKSLSDTSQMSEADTDIGVSIEGQWLLEHVVVNDSNEVRPADIDAESKLYAHFYNDSTFNFQTGCNAIAGRYVQTGDSIAMSNIMWTEMACDEMRVEELLKDVLPQVNTVDRNSDSIMRLNTPTNAYIVLKKCKARVKCTEHKDDKENSL